MVRYFKPRVLCRMVRKLVTISAGQVKGSMSRSKQ